VEQAASAMLLDPDNAALVVTGLPGVGKTLFLRDLAESTSEHFDHVLTMVYAGASTTEPAYLIEEINEFLKALGRGFSAEALQSQPMDRIIGTLAARLHGVRLLIVVDNAAAAPPGQIEQLLSAASTEPSIRVAMSARPPWRAPGSRTRSFNLPLFSEAESRAFISGYGSRADLIVDCEALRGRVPAGVRTHPQALAALMASIEDLPLDLALLDGLPANATAPLELIKSLVATLDPPVLTTLALVDAMDGQAFLPALTLLQWRPPARLGESLRELTSRALITRDYDVFRIPGIVAEALAANAPDAIATATAALGERAVALTERLCGEADPVTFRQTIALVADGASVLAKRARWDNVLAIADERFLERANLLGCWREYWFLLRLGVSAAEHTGDAAKRVRLLFRIAHKSLQMHDRETGHQALGDIAAAIGDAGNGAAHAELFSLRAFFAELDKSDADPLSLFNASLTIHQAHGDIHAATEVRCYMGHLYLNRRQFAEAKSCYEAVLSLTPGTAMLAKIRVDAECGLALCNINLTQPSEAKFRLQAAVEEAERAGYEAGLSQAHFYLALAADLEGNVEAVAEHLNKAEHHARTTNPRVLVAISLFRMKQSTTRKSQ
jgi:tetratricopeptide (TPR) repeat protein